MKHFFFWFRSNIQENVDLIRLQREMKEKATKFEALQVKYFNLEEVRHNILKSVLNNTKCVFWRLYIFCGNMWKKKLMHLHCQESACKHSQQLLLYFLCSESRQSQSKSHTSAWRHGNTQRGTKTGNASVKSLILRIN